MCWQEWVSLAAQIVAAVGAGMTGILALLGLRRGWQSPKEALKVAEQCRRKAQAEYEVIDKEPGRLAISLEVVETKIRINARRETGVTWGAMSKDADPESLLETGGSGNEFPMAGHDG